jgi:hypothetical protein
MIVFLLCQSFFALMAMEEKEKEIDPDEILISIKRYDGPPKAAKQPRHPARLAQPVGQLYLPPNLQKLENELFKKIRGKDARAQKGKGQEKYVDKAADPKTSAPPPAPAPAK